MLAFANADAESKEPLRARPDVYVWWLTWAYLYALRGAFQLTFPYTYTRNLKVSNISEMMCGQNMVVMEVCGWSVIIVTDLDWRSSGKGIAHIHCLQLSDVAVHVVYRSTLRSMCRLAVWVQHHYLITVVHMVSHRPLMVTSTLGRCLVRSYRKSTVLSRAFQSTV